MNNTQETAMDNDAMQPKKPQTSRRKQLIIAACVLVILIVIAAVVTIVTMLNAPSSQLLSSIQNTANQKMLQLSVDAKLQQEKTGASAISISNAKYKSGEGLSADASSNFSNEYGDLTTKTRWVVTSDKTIYAGLVSTDLKTSDTGKKLMAQYNMPNGAIVAMLNRDAGTWSKMDTSSDTGTSYGFDPCALQVAYTSLTNATENSDFFKKLAASHDLQVARKGNSYTVTLKSGASAINDLYKGSPIYATLKKCVDNNDSDMIQGGLGDLLTNAQLQFDVDVSNLIQKIIYTAKNGMNVVVAVGAAKDVSIKAPTVTPVEPLKAGETSEEYLKRTRPFVYAHLQEIGQISKGQ